MFCIKFGPGKINNSIQLSKTIKFAFPQNDEILMFSIPEASGLRGSIHLVKLVSHLLARAVNLPYGAKICKTCITNPKMYKKSNNIYKNLR